jgi:hypothetical protein
MAAALIFAGCNLDLEKPITVAVYPGADRCTYKIDDKESPWPCAELGRLFRDQLKLKPSRQIDVSMFRMDKAHDEKDVDRVADGLRTAGFTEVKVWRFAM